MLLKMSRQTPMPNNVFITSLFLQKHYGSNNIYAGAGKSNK